MCYFRSTGLAPSVSGQNDSTHDSSVKRHRGAISRENFLQNSMLTFEALKDNEKYYSDTSISFEEKEEKLMINRFESRLEEHYIVPCGLYHSIDDLIKTVNKTHSLRDHVTFTINRNGYVSAQSTCTHCINNEHTFYLSSILARILEYGEEKYNMSSDETF